MTSKVIGPYMFYTSTQFRRSRLVSKDRVFMIKYQHKSLVYRHIYFTDNHMLSVLVYACKPIICKDIDKKSMLYTGCIQSNFIYVFV